MRNKIELAGGAFNNTAVKNKVNACFDWLATFGGVSHSRARPWIVHARRTWDTVKRTAEPARRITQVFSTVAILKRR